MKRKAPDVPDTSDHMRVAPDAPAHAATPSDSPSATALTRLNVSVMSMFKAALAKDPTADLQSLFERYATEYPGRRAKALTRSSRPPKGQQPPPSGNDCQSSSSIDGPPPQSVPALPSFSSTAFRDPNKPRLSSVQRRILNLSDGPYAVAREFDAELISLLKLDSGAGTTLSDDVVKRLSTILCDAEVLGSQPHGRFVLRLSQVSVVKIGNNLEPAEAEILDFVRTSVPDVPVPVCQGILSNGRISLMFLSAIPGQCLSSLWPQLSHDEKKQVQQQLGGVMQRIRHIPTAVTELGWCGYAKDCRRNTRKITGTASEQDFNDNLIRPLLPTINGSYRDLIRSKLRDCHRIVFTHADLHPRNIIVQRCIGGDGAGKAELRLAGIVDWELAGWYPEYWEYVKALNTLPAHCNDADVALADWWRYLPAEIAAGYDAEWALDQILERVLAE
ncbi:kinase-like domain-containing protein [Sphaerosporella brunnea]|uniref:Kinase-like domain-containing protein n=1 Tax=Sphaerosporella brunnea TaxID=1250544 RepID=A0A5J5EKR0_9PEZI|nr:kinase-like domain-containing protein [Sphaerosporella brunnea]